MLRWEADGRLKKARTLQCPRKLTLLVKLLNLSRDR